MQRKKSSSSRRGRPKAQIDWDLVERLGGIFCTVREVAQVLGHHPDTINKRALEEKGMTLGQFLSKSQATGRVALRRAQFEKAMSGDVRMLIHLSKMLFGYSNRHTVAHVEKAPLRAVVVQREP